MRIAAVVPAVLATAALVAGSTPAASGRATALGPPPQICISAPAPSCLTKGGGGNTTVSPHIVRVGEKFTVTLESKDGEYSGIASYSDSGATGGTLIRCTGGAIVKVKPDPKHAYDAPTHMASARVCTYKATAPTNRWETVSIHFSVRYGGLASYSEDALAILPKGIYFVQGNVRTKPYPGSPKDGVGIAGMTVGVFSTAKGASGGYAFSKKVKTTNNGFYEVQVPRTGTYDVLGYLRPSDRKVKPLPTIEPARAEVTETSDKDTNLRLSRGVGMSVTLETLKGKELDSVPGNGVEHATAVIEVVSPNDSPVAGQPLTIRVNSGTGTPRAKICDGSGRVWPDADWGPSVTPTNRVTDSKGQFRLDVFFGSEPGTFRLDAYVTTNPRVADQAEVQVHAEKPAALTPASLAKAVWDAIARANSGGNFVLDPDAPIASGGVTQGTVGGSNAPAIISKYLSSVRGKLAGIEFTPISNTGDPSRATATGVAFYPSGSVVSVRNGSLSLPPSTLVLPVEGGNGLGALLNLTVTSGVATGTQIHGYTPVSIPSLGAWKQQHGVGGAVFGTAAGAPPVLYGGGPYLAGDILTSPCLNP